MMRKRMSIVAIPVGLAPSFVYHQHIRSGGILGGDGYC